MNAGNYTFTTSASSILTIPNSMEIKQNYDNYIKVDPEGSLIVDGDFKLAKGQEALAERIDRIEQVLGICPRKPDLEKEYPDLKDLGDSMDRIISKINHELLQTISNVTRAYEDFAEECELMDKLKSHNDNT